LGLFDAFMEWFWPHTIIRVVSDTAASAYALGSVLSEVPVASLFYEQLLWLWNNPSFLFPPKTVAYFAKLLGLSDVGAGIAAIVTLLALIFLLWGPFKILVRYLRNGGERIIMLAISVKNSLPGWMPNFRRAALVAPAPPAPPAAAGAVPMDDDDAQDEEAAGGDGGDGGGDAAAN